MSDDSSSTPSPRSRDAVREKAALVQTRQRRMRIARTVGVSALAVAVVAAVGVAVTQTFVSRTEAPLVAPSGMTQDGVAVTTLPAASAEALAAPEEGEDAPAPSAEPEPAAEGTVPPVAISVYVDYMSPDSAAFDIANADQITEWVNEGAATVTYYPVALLTAKSNGTKYSLRAAATAGCVATVAPDTFYPFNLSMLRNQPATDSAGMTNAELADVAIAAGATDPRAMRECIESGRYEAWAQEATARAVSTELGDTGAPLSGPTVLVNGEQYVGALDDPKDFAQFVLTLDSDAYYASPSPSPTAP